MTNSKCKFCGNSISWITSTVTNSSIPVEVDPVTLYVIQADAVVGSSPRGKPLVGRKKHNCPELRKTR